MGVWASDGGCAGRGPQIAPSNRQTTPGSASQPARRVLLPAQDAAESVKKMLKSGQVFPTLPHLETSSITPTTHFMSIICPESFSHESIHISMNVCTWGIVVTFDDLGSRTLRHGSPYHWQIEVHQCTGTILTFVTLSSAPNDLACMHLPFTSLWAESKNCYCRTGLLHAQADQV